MNTQLEIKVESTEQMYNSLLESFRNQSLRLETLSGNSRALQEQNNRLQSELEGYKQREEIVLQRPTLIERRANSAVTSLMREYECATANRETENCP